MPGVSNAVFLSYASEDAQAAERIATALRAAGVEVWFDKSELRGGDAWDRQIRGQIRDCALFIPLISQHSQERLEGYFRLEWKLAVDRSHRMAAERSFIVPVVVDSTRERDALVPDSFRDVQWTHLPGGEASTAFVARIAALLGAPAPVATTAGATLAPTTARPIGTWNRRAVWIPLGLVGLTIVVGGGWFGLQHSSLQRHAEAGAIDQSPGVTEKSIAVLPFIDMSEQHDQEYFADGIAESLLDTLVKVPHLRVIGRTSSFQFKGKNEDLRSIGAKLNADYLVEGSVRRSGSRMRVTAQLIEAGTGEHRWSDSFDRDVADTLVLQDEMSTAIARALEVATTPLQRGRVNPDAYTDLLRGKAAYDRGAWDEATAEFRRALSREPKLVEAAEGLILVNWIQLTATGTGSLEGTWARFKEAAETTLRIEPDSALAHAALGLVRAGFEYDWAGADRELERSLAASSGSAQTLSWTAWFAFGAGHKTKAFELINAATTLDPLNPDVHATLGAMLMDNRDFVRAEQAFRRSIKLSPTFPGNRACIAEMEVLGGRPAAAIEELSLESDNRERDVAYAMAYYALGRQSDSDAALKRILEDADRYPYGVAVVYANRGDLDRAFEWLDRAYDARSETLAIGIRWDPLLDPIRKDARYRDLLRKMNLPNS
jgi:TolB-like protein